MSERRAQTGVHIVMRPEETWDHVRAFLREHDMTFVKRWEKPEGINRIEEIWATSDRDDVAHIISDPISGTDYVWLHGVNEEPLALEMLIGLRFFAPASLFVDLENASDTGDIVDALFRIAVSFPSRHPQAEQAYCLYLRHGDPMVRAATIQAIAYRTIPAYFDLLEFARDHDPHEENRAFATGLLALLRDDEGESSDSGTV